MKKISTVVLSALLLLSGSAFAKHYVIVDDFYGTTIMKTHKVHYFGPGFLYAEKTRPVYRPVYVDAWGRPYVMTQKQYIVQEPVASFHFRF